MYIWLDSHSINQTTVPQEEDFICSMQKTPVEYKLQMMEKPL